MKKVLSLLLAFILIFSCFSILGTTAVLADEIITTVEDPVVLKSDFTSAATSKWHSTHDGRNNVSFAEENGEYYARVKSFYTDANGTSVGINSLGIVSTPFKLITGNEYELNFLFRIPEESATYDINDINYSYQPSMGFFEATTNAEGTSVTNRPQITAESANNTMYAYVSNTVSRRATFTSNWIVGDNAFKRDKNSFVQYDTTGYKAANGSDIKTIYTDWTPVTVKFTAIAKESSETSQTAAFGIFFYGKAFKGLMLDIKDVKLVNKSVSGGADAPDLKADQAFFNDFKAGFVENIEADRSELTLVKEDSDINGDTQYLRYVSMANSNGVAFNFTNNPNYKYKISYDLKVGAKGSGTLKTTAASTTELFDHSNATVGDWQHYEYDFSDATAGDVEVKLLVDAAGWQVGIDNLKVEMVSNANLETADDITTGTYAFNIRSQSDDKGQGLRFKSSISFNKINLDEGAKIVEYGTLVTAAANIASLKLENVDNTKVLAGVAYNADEKKDIRYSFDNDTGELVYTGVITGITPQNYDEELAVCGYTVVKTVSGARFVIYDAVKEISVLAAAEQIVAESQSEDDKAAAQEVINAWKALNP